MAADVTPRQSDLALVIARLAVGSQVFWLLRRHPKWGDWSLVGGHVEPDEELDWSLTAEREAAEELAPLRCGDDFTVEPLLEDVTTWGPVHSRSAHGALTNYRARWYRLRFLRDALDCLLRLPRDEFALVPEPEIARGTMVSDVALRLLGELDHDTGWIPFSGRLPGPDLPLRLASAGHG